MSSKQPRLKMIKTVSKWPRLEHAGVRGKVSFPGSDHLNKVEFVVFPPLRQNCNRKRIKSYSLLANCQLRQFARL